MATNARCRYLWFLIRFRRSCRHGCLAPQASRSTRRRLVPASFSGSPKAIGVASALALDYPSCAASETASASLLLSAMASASPLFSASGLRSQPVLALLLELASASRSGSETHSARREPLAVQPQASVPALVVIAPVPAARLLVRWRPAFQQLLPRAITLRSGVPVSFRCSIARGLLTPRRERRR